MEFTGAIYYQFMLGTPVNNSARENVHAVYTLVKMSHEYARSKGFKISIVHNTSPLTQVCLLVKRESEKTGIVGKKFTEYFLNTCPAFDSF